MMYMYWTSKSIEQMINENLIRFDLSDLNTEPDLYEKLKQIKFIYAVQNVKVQLLQDILIKKDFLVLIFYICILVLILNNVYTNA